MGEQTYERQGAVQSVEMSQKAMVQTRPDWFRHIPRRVLLRDDAEPTAAPTELLAMQARALRDHCKKIGY